MLLKASKRIRKFFNRNLTNEAIWQEIIREGKLNNLHQLTDLSAEAAFHLVKNEKRMQLLSLGITELSPVVAEELAKYKGYKLYLNCVRNLSLEAAKSIACFKGAKLTLNGLKTITLPVLGRLALYRGTLHLEGVETVEIGEQDRTRAETVFNNLGFASLSLSCLRTPSSQLLQALSRFPGKLELNAIGTLSQEEAQILGQHIGNWMSLQGIKILSAQLQQLMLHYKGVLDLSGGEEIEESLLYMAGARPQGYTLLGAEVKKKIDNYKKELLREKKQRQEEERHEKRKKEEREKEREQELMAEFEKFDEMELTPPAWAIQPLEREEKDEFDVGINDEVLEDIEINLNLKINQKKRRVDALLAKGFSKLSPVKKQELQQLREEIRELKEKIRRALDILVERKELGSIVFNSSSDLAAYLKALGAEDDEDDALADIEDKDLFANCFGTHSPESKQILKGNDFIIEIDSQ